MAGGAAPWRGDMLRAYCRPAKDGHQTSILSCWCMGGLSGSITKTFHRVGFQFGKA
jgi:hypothetical protein